VWDKYREYICKGDDTESPSYLACFFYFFFLNAGNDGVDMFACDGLNIYFLFRRPMPLLARSR
jgi:hypothetical protein